jgi:FlaA1/EpsC-like NDP-sugar epimerase
MFITTRFGNVLGSNGSVIPRFQQQIEKGGPITVTHPDITRYFMTIPEACQLVIEAGVMGQGGEIFAFDMGQPVKIVDLAHKMIRLSGKKPGVDIQVVYSGLRPGEKLYEEVLNNAENTLPTYHEKIMIAQVREYDFTFVTEKIDQLISSARKHYTYETVALMKDLVPEYISNNSTFESLDVKV